MPAFRDYFGRLVSSYSKISLSRPFMDWLCQAVGDHTCKIKKLVSKTGEPFLVTSKTSMFCTHAPLPAKLKKKLSGTPYKVNGL